MYYRERQKHVQHIWVQGSSILFQLPPTPTPYVGIVCLWLVAEGAYAFYVRHCILIFFHRAENSTLPAGQTNYILFCGTW